MENVNGRLGSVRRNRRTRAALFAGALAIVALMVFSGAAASGLADLRSAAGSPAGTHLSLAATSTPWTYPTTTQQEPGYTGGNYILASTSDVEYLNVYKFTDAYSAELLGEIYDSLDAYTPNQTYIPWAASGWGETTAPAGMTTFDPLTGTTTPVAYIYNVTIRPGIQWSDWTTATASSTYVYSNTTSFSLYNSTSQSIDQFTHTYSWPSVTMSTEQIQSADLILSWEILATSADYAGIWSNIVNVVPTSNLTADFYLGAQSATFVTYTLSAPILPYHIWKSHDWADENTAAWNYTGTGSPNGYDSWDVGYNPQTDQSSQLIGSGPFMFSNAYGQTPGAWVPNDYWTLYVNPHYFVQYVPALETWSPKINEITVPLYLSESAAVAAQGLGEVDTQLQPSGNDPSFLPTLKTISDTTIFYQQSGNFDYMGLNPNSYDSPMNVTAFRQALNYATNKAYLSAVIGEGFSTLGQPTVPVADALWHNFTAPQYTYSPSEAASLLASIPGMTKNGAGDLVYLGHPVSLDLQITPASITPEAVEGALIVAQEWSSLGIPTTVTQEAFSTLVANLVGNSYQIVDLGITGIEGDPTGDFFDFYNSSVGTGTGFYEGPYSSLTVNGQALSGPQVSELMNNLTNELNTITNLGTRTSIALEIEGIAAQESTIINLGYPIAILPFANSTFSGLIEDSLAYQSFMYWNFLSFHLKGTTVSTPPATIPTQLRVGVVAASSVYTNGEYGNVTVQVRNQYGAPEAGMNVTVGFKPSGQLLNVSDNFGVTNAQGQYTWEFQVYAGNPQIFSSDYAGSINITAAASPGKGITGDVIGSAGWTSIDVEPEAVAYSADASPLLSVGHSPSPFSIEVYNPATGAPVSGYAYTVQALSGAVNLSSGASGQSVVTTTSYDPLRPDFGGAIGFASVEVTNQTDYNLTSLSGVTGSNGLITVDLQANGSANFSAMGSSFESWLFIGNYAQSSPLTGASPYDVLGELTSSFDPTGFGQLQPFEIPLTVADVAPSVHLALSVAGGPIGPSGTLTVTATATNSTSHAPVVGYTVTLVSQNALGANRGTLSNPAGTPVEAFNPNSYFGSTFLPGITLVTNATGVAVATFSPGLYTPASTGGTFSGFASAAYTDPNLIPFDEFELSASGNDSVAAAATANSSAMVSNTPASTTAAAYFAGSGSLNDVVLLTGNATYPMYVNTTADSAWGPAVGSVPVNVTATVGTIAGASGTTSSSGSYSTTYSAPNVGVLTAVTVAITYGPAGANTTLLETIYLSAAPAAKSVGPSTPGKNSTSSSNSTLTTELEAAAAAFGILAVIFAALWVAGRRKPPEPTVQPWSPSSSTASSGSPGGASSSSPPGGEAPKGPGGS